MQTKKTYLYKEYRRDMTTLKMTFVGWACGMNGTSNHAIFPTKKEAIAYNTLLTQ